jgi:segregation and condensation protein B
MDKAKAAQKLSRSALESLAIIAYKQPLVRSEIEEIRGVETSGVLRTLCERKLVRIVGRKDVPGRPIMYGTTKFFLEHFGLQDLSQLPPLREFKELGESEQALLPIEEESLAGC